MKFYKLNIYISLSKTGFFVQYSDFQGDHMIWQLTERVPLHIFLVEHPSSGGQGRGYVTRMGTNLKGFSSLTVFIFTFKEILIQIQINMDFDPDPN